MGTGSPGGGGGGSGAGIGASVGGYRDAGGGRFRTRAIRTSVLKETVRRVFQRLSRHSKDYLLEQCTNSTVAGAYESIFNLEVHLLVNRSWNGVEREDGVDGGPGCLVRWADAVIERSRTPSDSEAMLQVARHCLDCFLLESVGGDSAVFFEGDANAVLDAVDRSAFDRLPGLYFSALLEAILRREQERVPPSAEVRFRDEAEAIAGRVLNAFKTRFHAKGQVTFRQLFSVLAKNADWLRKELRK